MAKIKKIRLTDLMFYNTVTKQWENLYAVDTAATHNASPITHNPSPPTNQGA